VLHWKAGKPPGISNNQQRYTLTDHLGSSALELDEHANIITQEHYYPFGGTAWSNGEAVQVSYKIVRYSGKERDATGLYYYGFRYYIAWLQRWVNPDPAGDIDGLNIFVFVRDNPIRYKDANGLGLELTNNVRDYLVSKRGQDVSVDVDTFKKFFFMAKLSGSRVSVLDEATGNYESTDEFQVVEVGVGSREELLRRNPRGVIASDEVKSTLNIYGLKYTSLMNASSHRWFERRQWGKEAARQRGNFAAGEYVSRHFSNWLVLGERTRQMDVDLNGAPDNRLFALIKKTDLVKEPSERTIYGISMISVTRKDDGSNEAALNVDYTIVHPDAQITRSDADSSDAGASTGAWRLRGAGTFLTMNAINLVSRTVNMKTIHTSAINPRSAAMAMGWGEASPF
uniref:RHS repeat-associated core domain-containing protein n=1 Tax=Pseudomonas sp. Ant30-3 TaxID=1488328 RepID=UPI00048B5F99